jgi:hypothetical protein
MRLLKSDLRNCTDDQVLPARAAHGRPLPRLKPAAAPNRNDAAVSPKHTIEVAR